MRILDVAPRTTVPPMDGATVRMYHLLGNLSRNHEVRQFTQPRLSQIRAPGFEREVHGAESYLEYRNTNRLSALVTDAGRRSWAGVPMLAGAGLRLARPQRLLEWIDWADVVVVEFPWQFAWCRRRTWDKPLVLASHNLEIQKFVAYAEAAGTTVRNSYLYRYAVTLERRAATQADLITAV
ncbi:MAG: glycosyltransferase, partial [bacterium]|nr:glycosyltransferase [bacterium]